MPQSWLRGAAGPKGAIGHEHTSPGPAAELSQREQEVFALLASGPSNKDLAAQLHLTERTVKAHIASILRKLAMSRLQACLLAQAYRHARLCESEG